MHLVTAHVCAEYFTIGHPPVFHTDDPIRLALGWGVIAMWWVGLGLGIGLARAAAGRKPSAAKPVVTAPPIALLLLILAACAASMGFFGYWLAESGPRDDGRGRVVDSAREAFAVHGRLAGTHDELCGWPRGRPRRDGASLARAMPSELPRPRRSFARIAISRSRLWPWASLRIQFATSGRSHRSCRSAPGR